jgi:type VI secretion system secreted protein VgrG
MADDSARFGITINGPGVALRVARFEGWEAISSLFEFLITVYCDDGALDLEHIVGEEAVFSMHGDDGHAREIRGIVADIVQGHAGHQATAYEVRLVPGVAPLALGSDYRVFTDMRAGEIALAVLSGVDSRFVERRGGEIGAQVMHDIRVFGSGDVRPDRGVREYCVQFGESDWSFLNRLLEEEGAFSYFDAEHTKLVLADDSGAAPPIAGVATLPFREPTGALAHGEHVFRFHAGERLRPGRVSVGDHCFEWPRVDLLACERGDDGGRGRAEIYEYPGRHDMPQVARARARVGLERWQAERRRAEGESACVRLSPGHVFTLEHHPRADFNGGWFLTHVEHRGHEPVMGEDHGDEPRYENRFRAIPASVRYRPALVTPKPSVRGVQTAVVTGPPGEAIYTDRYGRVRVQFHWDRRGRDDDRSSCWLRVAQLSAGPTYGTMFLPRVGHEVLVDFIDGDPDRPIVVGQLYNAANPVPHALPDAQTRSTIKTRSVRGDGFNELSFEDASGKEEIYLHAERDLRLEVKNDRHEAVKRDHKLRVGGDAETAIDGAAKLVVAGALSEKVDGDHRAEVGKTHTLVAREGLSIECGGAKVTIGQSGEVTIEGASIAVKGSDEVRIEGAKLELHANGPVNLKASGAVKVRGTNVGVN